MRHKEPGLLLISSAVLLGALACVPLGLDRSADEFVTLRIKNVGDNSPLPNATVEAESGVTLQEGEDPDAYLDRWITSSVRSATTDERGEATLRFGIIEHAPLRSPLVVRVTHGEMRETLLVELSEGVTTTADQISVTIVDISVRP